MRQNHTNRLANEQSPYLLQHAHNPVDWYPWGNEAFQKARAENKPIFLSIGYATCHWCHVMERESFESEEVAKVLNNSFVSIKVDREERPDVDKIYMNFVQAMTGQGGWPLSVWLTPELEPFYGGTYFPPKSHYGRPAFIDLLIHIHELWKEREGDMRASANVLRERMQEEAPPKIQQKLNRLDEIIQRAGDAFKAQFDPKYGGFGGAPKFPRPVAPLFLLRYADQTHDMETIDMVHHTCRKMILGGICDQIGGGFHRYSVDAEWLMPHFEKMLYDQAQLLSLFSELYLLRPDSLLLSAVESIHAYLQRDMRYPEGAFYSAEDADSEGREGLFYVWRVEELKKLLTVEEYHIVESIFGVTEKGNFIDHSDPDPLPNLNVLSRVNAPRSQEEETILRQAMHKMFEARSKRTRPLRDDKILTSWNSLLISGYARAGAVFGQPEYLEIARGIVSFIEKNLKDSSKEKAGKLCHRYRNGVRDNLRLLEDHAFYLVGLIDLYESTLELQFLLRAKEIADQTISLFYDQEKGGFWQSETNDPHLIFRMKDEYDGAEPSGNSAVIFALSRLSILLEDKSYFKIAQHSLAYFTSHFQNIPTALPHLLSALCFISKPPLQIVISGDLEDNKTKEFLKTAHSIYHSHRVILHASIDHPSEFIRSLGSEEPTAYLCENQSCHLPIYEPEELKRQLRKLI